MQHAKIPKQDQHRDKNTKNKAEYRASRTENDDYFTEA